jgi:chromosome segregation ATPase
MSQDKLEKWTPEYVGSLVGETFNGAWKIADTHNAALAVERKAVSKLEESISSLLHELAAEREKYQRSQEKMKEYFGLLAAELEKVALLGESRIAVDQAELLSLREKVNDLEEQLAAEREKYEGIIHHMEACRALLKVPNDEVLYGAIEELQRKLAAEKHVTAGLVQNLNDCDQQLSAEREARTRAKVVK